MRNFLGRMRGSSQPLLAGESVPSRTPSGAGFAVLDFETTGLFPGGHDRMIEVAIVHVTPDGEIEGHWDTLVNPGRDLGKQAIHHIGPATTELRSSAKTV
jgi:DNA polymerase III epsilon subunit-like protein